MSRLVNPWIQFDAENGQTYDGGSVFFGVANKDPVTNPKVPFDSKSMLVADEIGARQILNDKGDFKTEIFLKGFYSMSLFDKKGNFIRTSPEVEGSTPDSGFYVENYDTFALAVAAAAGSQLFISTVIDVTGSITVSGLTLRFIQGGKLKASLGTVITLNGEIDAGSFEIFDNTATGLIKGNFNGADLDAAWWGATGTASRAITTAAIRAGLTTMAEAIAASTDRSTFTMTFNALNYEVDDAIPLSSSMHLKMPAWRGGRFDQSAAKPLFYSATFSGGVFTDNLDQPSVVNAANDITLTNIRIDHTGATITGNSPDSATPWLGVIHFVNTSLLNVSRMRIDLHADDQTPFTLKNTFFVNFNEYVTTCSSAFNGGFGLNVLGLCNNALFQYCRIQGGFERGYSFDATVSSMDSTTLLECDAEGIDFTDNDTPTNGGVGTAVWCGGTQFGNRISQFRVLGGYYENNNVDFQLGSTPTGVMMEYPIYQHAYHGATAVTTTAYSLVNCSGHEILKPRMEGWNVQRFTLNGVVGVPADNDIINCVDRFGNAITGEVVSWDAGGSIVAVTNMQGAIDPVSAVTFTGSGATATDITNVNNVPFYGAPGNTHFAVDAGGRVLGGHFDLSWYSGQDFKPRDVGLHVGSGSIRIDGADNDTVEYSCEEFWTSALPIQAPVYRETQLTQAEVTAARTFFKIVIPNNNYGQTINLQVQFFHQSETISTPENDNDISHCELSTTVVTSYSGATGKVEFVLDNVTNGVETGALATVSPIVVGDFTSSIAVNANDIEIDLLFKAQGAEASTNNTLYATAIVERFGGAQVYSGVFDV